MHFLKQGDALSPFHFKFGLECHHEGPKSREGLELNGTHQLLLYAADDVLGKIIKIMKKITKVL
jgi:hypothetical protein